MLSCSLVHVTSVQIHVAAHCGRLIKTRPGVFCGRVSTRRQASCRVNSVQLAALH